MATKRGRGKVTVGQIVKVKRRYRGESLLEGSWRATVIRIEGDKVWVDRRGKGNGGRAGIQPVTFDRITR